MQVIQEILKKVKEVDKPRSNFTSKIPSLIKYEQYVQLKKIIEPHISEIENEIHGMLKRISNCRDLKEAQSYFDIIQKIGEVLGVLIGNKIIKMTDSIEEFLIQYERLDDICLRKYLFESLKKGEKLL